MTSKEKGNSFGTTRFDHGTLVVRGGAALRVFTAGNCIITRVATGPLCSSTRSSSINWPGSDLHGLGPSQHTIIIGIPCGELIGPSLQLGRDIQSQIRSQLYRDALNSSERPSSGRDIPRAHHDVRKFGNTGLEVGKLIDGTAVDIPSLECHFAGERTLVVIGMA